MQCIKYLNFFFHFYLLLCFLQKLSLLENGVFSRNAGWCLGKTLRKVDKLIFVFILMILFVSHFNLQILQLLHVRCLNQNFSRDRVTRMTRDRLERHWSSILALPVQPLIPIDTLWHSKCHSCLFKSNFFSLPSWSLALFDYVLQRFQIWKGHRKRKRVA